MNIRFSSFLLSILVASPAVAKEVFLAEIADMAGIADSVSKGSRWRFGAGYSQMLGLKAEFRGFGGFNNSNIVQPLGGGINRDYDNGFVRIDSSDNAGGLTWNWSYADDAQYSPANTGSIDFSITNSIANARTEEKGGGQPGVDLFAYYDMGAATLLDTCVSDTTWGFRFGLQYNRIDMGNNKLLNMGLTTTTDRFDLDGVIPPLAPYTGSFLGPGPLLGDSPIRSISPGGTGFVSGNREIELDLALLNFGTYLEIPVTKKFDLFFEAGLSLGLASGSYSFQSATTITGLGTQNSAGSNSSTDILPGAYLGLGANYTINDNWSIFANGRSQYMDSFDLNVRDTAATLSFDSAFLLSLGCIYSF